jgi:peptide/nickel transport system substrate-binding protein
MSPRGARAQSQTPVVGGRLTYLEQQAHTNLYPPAGGFYPNGGVLNQIIDKLTYQKPEYAEDRALACRKLEFQPGADGIRLQAAQERASDGAPLASALCFQLHTAGMRQLLRLLRIPLRNEAIMRHI